MAFAAGGYNAWLKRLPRARQGHDEGRGDDAARRRAGRRRRRHPRRRPDRRSAARAARRRPAVDDRDRHDAARCRARSLAIVLPHGPALYVARRRDDVLHQLVPRADGGDGRRPRAAGPAVAAQGLVHLHDAHVRHRAVVVGRRRGLERHDRCTTAMWVPTGALVLAALAMLAAAMQLRGRSRRARCSDA